MKNLCLYTFFALSVLTCHAQAPQSMSYQAVLRNTSNQPLPQQQVNTRIQIHQGSEIGPVVYEETHNTSTNENGLVSLIIGAGENVSGSIQGIEWESGPYFISSETDPDGGNNYSLNGNSRLLSVPYALYSNESGSSIAGPQGEQGPQGEPGPQGLPGPQGPTGLSGCDIVAEGNLAVVYTNNEAIGYSQSQSSIGTNYNIGNFSSTSTDGPILGTVCSKYQIALWTQSTVYGFYQSESSLGSPPNLNTGAWVSTSITGNPLGAISNNENLVVYTDSNLYGLSQARSTLGNPPNLSNATWTSTTVSGSFVKAIATSRSIIIVTSTHVYAFNQSQGSSGSEPNNNAGNWVSSTLNGSPNDVVISR